MTELEFRRLYEKSGKSERFVNYFFATVLLLIGFVFEQRALLLLVTMEGKPFFERVIAWLLMSFIFGVLIILPAVYGFWRIPRDKIIWSLNLAGSTDYRERIALFCSNNKFRIVKQTDNLTFADRQVFLIGVELRILQDGQNLLYNIRPSNAHKGWWEFGLVERMRKRFVRQMTQVDPATSA